MGAKGSRVAPVSRLSADDFRVADTSAWGMHAQPTALATWEGKDGAVAAEGRMLAVGGDDGSVCVFGMEGVQIKLYEQAGHDTPSDAPPAASDSSSSTSAPSPKPKRVLFVAFLSARVLITVHPHLVKLWDLESMSEVFALRMRELPPLTVGSGAPSSMPYELTCAALSTEMESRYVWLGTMQGAVLLFDSVARRLSQYVVPLQAEVHPAGVRVDSAAVHAAALAATASGLMPPSAVTALAQLPTDHSQLLIGYASDAVLSWHVSTQKLHRVYKRQGAGAGGSSNPSCGGVTALCWELGPQNLGSTADHFAVGHKNGLITVWKRKTNAAPAASLFLSPAPGPRAPISCLRWSTRSAGFFVSGGQLLEPVAASAPTPAAAAPTDGAAAAPPVSAPSPVEQGGVVFVSGARFELRRVVASPIPGDGFSNGSNGSDRACIGQFVQVQMVTHASAPTRPSPSSPTASVASASSPSSHNASSPRHPSAVGAAPSPSGSGPAGSSPAGAAAAPKLTAAFLCVQSNGLVSVCCPTIHPPVPPLPLSDLHAPPGADLVRLLSATPGDTDTATTLRELFSTLRSSLHPSQKLWTSLVRTSLVTQGLWPLTGGLSSRKMHALEIQSEEEMMANLRVMGTPTHEKDTGDDEPEVAPPMPALLLTTHSGAAASLRLWDATSPFELSLLASIPLARLMPPSARVTAALFCPTRLEVLLGTSTGEVMLFRLERFKAPETPAAAAPASVATGTAAAPTPTAAVAPADASAAAPATPTASKQADGVSRPASPVPPKSPSPAPSTGTNAASATPSAAAVAPVAVAAAAPAGPTAARPASPPAAAPAAPTSPKEPQRPASPPAASAPPQAALVHSPTNSTVATGATGATAAAAPPAATAAAAAAPSSRRPSRAPVQLGFDLVYRFPFSKHPISLVSFAPEVSKYFLCDEDGAFALLRPDTGVAIKQAIPNAFITAAHFSSELLVHVKSPLTSSSLFLYVCASDGSVHILCANAEARLAVLPALSTDAEPNRGAEAVLLMHTMTVAAEQPAEVGAPRATAAATSSPPTAAAAAPQRYVLSCTSSSISLVCAGSKAPETLLSIRVPVPIRHAFIVSSPQRIEAEEDVSAAAAAPISAASSSSGSPGPTSTVPPPCPAHELCLAVVDEKAVLHVYAVNLQCLLSAPLHMEPSALTSLSFSLSADGRMVLLPHRSSLRLASLFPPSDYHLLAPPARLLPPPDLSLAVTTPTSSSSVPSGSAAAPSTGESGTTGSGGGGGGWFASLRGAVSHETLFAPAMFSEAQLAAIARGKAKSDRRAEGDDAGAAAAADRARHAQAEGDAARAHWDAVKASKQGAAASSDGGAAGSGESLQQARSQVSGAQQQMALNNQLAANNLRRAEEVADKSELMAEHANDFLAAARALRKKQESSWW